MKKIMTLGSVLIGVVLLAGCGQQQVSQTQLVSPVPKVAQQHNKNKASVTQSTTINETVNWKIYTNFGYSFKYPDQKITFELSDNSDSDQDVNTILKVNNDNHRVFYFSPIDKSKTGPLDEASLGQIVINKNTPTGAFTAKSLDEYFKKRPGLLISSVIKSNYGNISWRCGFSTTPAGGKFKDCFTKISGDVYQMRFQIDSEGYFTENDFDHIVKSFQLTD
jgi:outer membrane murein-binding lipoprotein Lpp